jgi:condensin complex subunit 2
MKIVELIYLFFWIRLSLNDDRNEKAARMQSRQALQDIHLNQIKAAASPMRKRIPSDSHRKPMASSPRTPRSTGTSQRDKENDDPDANSSPGMLNVVSGSAVTPMKRVPILADFEQWMKMATDNKINAANSWNFALIDYFHDMSLLKEGDGVNFQKASCTLDGCVKIYTSRVDSVANETGKLLSGLADSAGGKKAREKNGDGEEEDDDDEEDEGEDGVKKKVKKNVRWVYFLSHSMCALDKC